MRLADVGEFGLIRPVSHNAIFAAHRDSGRFVANVREREQKKFDRLLAFGRALQAQSKSDEARAAFRSAAEKLQATVGANHPDTRRARQMAESKS